ncbi:Transcriptional activator [Gurleya vavrai]
MNSEQPLYVNLKQYDCIRKRKIRRDFLDTLMAEANQAGYLHESRHKHAMNRQRAPSGRFLTKEETEAMKRNENYNSEN